jgi:hypothetical protein
MVLSGSEPPLLLLFRELRKVANRNFGDFFGYFLNRPFSFPSHVFSSSRR